MCILVPFETIDLYHIVLCFKINLNKRFQKELWEKKQKIKIQSLTVQDNVNLYNYFPVLITNNNT